MWSKPDPNEPWRYVCPDCGGQVRGHGTSRNYYCDHCRWKGRVGDVYDKKKETVSGPYNP